MADERVDRLFTLPPEDFTAERNALVREVRKAGDRSEAQRIGELRRPTLAAWAVNQAVRGDPEGYDELLDVGRNLRQTLRRAVSGVQDADVRGAGRARRQAVQRMTQQAVDALAAAGRDAATHRDDIVATFEAASADEDAGARIASARLSQPLDAPSGFGDLSPLTLAETAPEPEEQQPPPAQEAESKESKESNEKQAAVRAVAAARERAQAASEEALQRRRDADAAQNGFEQAAAEADDAAREVARAQRAADRAGSKADAERRRAERLQREAADAQASADRRARELREAQERLEQM